MLQDGTCSSKQINLREYEEQNELLSYRGKLFLLHHPLLLLHVLQQYHDIPESGHCDQVETFQIVAQEFIWFGMCKAIARYIHNCYICQ
jgi:hypothetical protein